MVNFSDPVLIGDNPFFGVDHLSQERSRAKINKIGNIGHIIKILSYSEKLGVKGFVVSTRPELKDLIEKMSSESDLIHKIEFYPIIPYLQRYVTKMTEKGMVGTVQDLLEPASVTAKVKLLMKGGLSLLKKDLNEMFRLFIDLELLNLQNCNMRMIFLHDVIVDLALSLGQKDLFLTFEKYTQEKYGLQGGLVTKNLPLLLKRFQEWGMTLPPIMMAVNKIGYQMNPSREVCEDLIKEFNPYIIAMSTLAAGYLNPREGLEYVLKIPQVKSVVVGVSSEEHANNTFNIISDFLKSCGR